MFWAARRPQVSQAAVNFFRKWSEPTAAAACRMLSVTTSGRSGAIKHGSRHAPCLRRREGTCFSSPSDDEVGAIRGAIRAKRAKSSGAIKHGSRHAPCLRRRVGTCFSSPSDDEVGAIRGAIPAGRAWRARQSAQCPRWDSNPCWGGFKPPASAIWATGASYPKAGCDPSWDCVQRDASAVGVVAAPPSFVRVSGGRFARLPVAMRSSMTTFPFGSKCTGCTPVIKPVALSRK